MLSEQAFITMNCVNVKGSADLTNVRSITTNLFVFYILVLY